jgi:hypothetical protein
MSGHGIRATQTVALEVARRLKDRDLLERSLHAAVQQGSEREQALIEAANGRQCGASHQRHESQRMFLTEDARAMSA